MSDIPVGKIELRDAGPDPSLKRRVEYGQSLYASGKADGAREEREAVVRLLRRRSVNYSARSRQVLTKTADLIEAGEHRKP